MHKGHASLSNIELLAVILGSGTKNKSVLTLAQEILSQFGSLTSLLDASVEDLCEIKGLGQAKALQLKATLALSTRMRQEHICIKEPLLSPLRAYLWVRDHVVYEKKEVFGVILLDVKRAAIKWEVVSIGTLTASLVHPREVFYPAIHHRACSMILVHNHPSGDPTPSEEDCITTDQLIKASAPVGVHIIDHLIIGRNGFTSFKESGLAFPDPDPTLTKKSSSDLCAVV